MYYKPIYERIHQQREYNSCLSYNVIEGNVPEIATSLTER